MLLILKQELQDVLMKKLVTIMGMLLMTTVHVNILKLCLLAYSLVDTQKDHLTINS